MTTLTNTSRGAGKVTALKLRLADRLSNPPIILRAVCRYCGAALTVEDVPRLCITLSGDAWAHQACWERERP